MHPSMPVLVVGSVALDSVRTPAGQREEALGGSAAYFGVAASHYATVRMVAVVGTDFPERYVAVFRRCGIDCTGLTTAEGRTFRWAGVYADDMKSAPP
jgi:sugar/nucleoside kinase (ribokinase family)